VVVEDGGELVATITGYRLPDEPKALFVWQVAVRSDQRGRSLGRRMLNHLARRLHPDGVDTIHTTVGPTNEASNRMFHSFADKIGCPITHEPYIAEDECGPGHDAEDLLRIGPFSPEKITTTNA